MLIKKAPELTYADVTPKHIYVGRRNLLLGLQIRDRLGPSQRTYDVTLPLHGKPPDGP